MPGVFRATTTGFLVDVTVHHTQQTSMDNANALSETEWSLVVRRRLGNDAVFKVLDVSAGPVGDQVSGFIGDHLRVQVTVLLLNNERNVLKFFVKRVPEGNEFRTAYAVSTDSFSKETEFYSKVVQHFRRHGLSEQFPWAAECYFTRPDILVMEELIEQGFTLHDKYKHMDYSHCVAVIKTLANFHSSSIVLEENESKRSGKVYKLSDGYSELLFENVFVSSGKSLTQHWFRSSIKALTALLPLMPNYGVNSKLYTRVLEKFSGTVEKIFTLIQPSDEYRNVICHGDPWCHNILFRFSDDSNAPEEARLVDFQTYRYTPPAVDVMSFLHLTTSRAFRAAHEDRLLRVYHESMSQELETNGCEADHLLPWQQFLDSCHHYKTLGRIVASLYLHLLVLPDKAILMRMNSPSLLKTFLLYDRTKEIVHCFNVHADYRLRLTEVLEEMIECDILKH